MMNVWKPFPSKSTDSDIWDSPSCDGSPKSRISSGVYGVSGRTSPILAISRQFKGRSLKQEIQRETRRRSRRAKRNWWKVRQYVMITAVFISLWKDVVNKKIYGHTTVIGDDEADDPEEEEDRKKVQRNLAQMLFPTIAPASHFRRSWDLVSIFIVLFSVFSTTFEIGFDVEVTGYMALVLSAISIFFWLDLVLNFFTSFTEDAELVEDRRRIATKYLRSFFFVDLISNLPYGEVGALSQGIWGNMRLAKGLRLFRVGRVLDRWGEAGYNSTMLHLFKMFFFILVTGHVTACLWFYVASLEGHGEDSWTTMNDLGAGTTASLSSKYLASLYFAYTTLTTVGFGDISAHTNGERIVALFAVVAGSAIFAGIISTITSLAERSNHREIVYHQKLNNINDFMKSAQIPKEMRARVRLYYDFNFRKMDYTEMIQDLSPSLQNDILCHVFRDIAGGVPFLRGQTRDFLNAFIRKMQHVMAFEKELIVTVNFVETHLHIVHSGIVEGLNTTGAVVTKFTMGSFFGESSALSSSRARMSFRAHATMELYMVSREDVRGLFNDFPKFKERLQDVSKTRAAIVKELLARKGGGDSRKKGSLGPKHRSSAKPAQLKFGVNKNAAVVSETKCVPSEAPRRGATLEVDNSKIIGGEKNLGLQLVNVHHQQQLALWRGGGGGAKKEGTKNKNNCGATEMMDLVVGAETAAAAGDGADHQQHHKEEEAKGVPIEMTPMRSHSPEEEEKKKRRRRMSLASQIVSGNPASISPAVTTLPPL